jgi:HAD superfamily hydrolase (TIGR01509 family)
MQYPIIMFDWGDTVMKDSPDLTTPMYQWPTVEVVEGAEEVLKYVQAQATIILATSAAQSDEADIRRALHRVNIDAYFHKIYCFKNTGYKKPAPEFYAHILRDLGANPSDVLMIGDSFENDVLGATRVGIRAVWLNRESEKNASGDLYRTIHSLRELLPIVTPEEKK